MKTATAVIGANWGDEGKGLMTDYFAHQAGPETIVVRYCGGANAGHTVVEPTGRRHVFHHFSSGTLAHAATYLDKNFIVNPFLWQKELTQLQNIGVIPNSLMHPEAMLSTPYDMLINQEVERARGKNAHGSCGVGINETMQRCQTGLATHIHDMNTPQLLRTILNVIRQSYVPKRFKRLNVEPSDTTIELIASDDLLENYLDCCIYQLKPNIFVFRPEALNSHGKNFIFEGSQGLLLDRDQDNFFPHVTNAKTGLENVIETAADIGIEEINAVYVTRTYATRHGAGPFPGEDEGLNHLFDNTNVDHEFQGKLRFGHLDTELMAKAISNDFSNVMGTNITVNPSLAVTHLDQHPMPDFSNTGIRISHVSHGPTRDNVKHYSSQLRHSA